MNSAALEPPISNTRRWLFWLVLVFLSQLALIYFLSDRNHKTVIPSPIATPLQLLPGHLTEAQFSETFLASDPALFATANPHGFSAGAWLKAPPRAYEEDNFVEHTEPSYWLALNLRQFGSSISQFIQTNSTASGKSSENIAPKIQLTQIVDDSVKLKPSSKLGVEGELISRELFNPPQLQSWAHMELLSNSIAQVAVDRRGLVISARLLSRSGFSNADNNALEIARNLQFSPSAINEITWGKLIFQWQTLPLIATNSELKTIQP